MISWEEAAERETKARRNAVGSFDEVEKWAKAGRNR
jgi:hypothetical protein